MMNILACASDSYAMQCGVLFLSICQNNQETPIRFFVLTDYVFQDINKVHLEDIIHRYNTDNSLHFITVDDVFVSDFQDVTSKFYPKQVMYRLLAADLLPNDIDRVLYLDCDIIVRHGLRDLWETDLSHSSVACVPDALSGLVGIFNRLGYPQKYGYFNSGVLLINLQYWREHKISQKFIDFAKTTHVNITLPDQDMLNSVLHKSKIFIPLTFNSQSGFLYKLDHMKFDYYGNKDEIELACSDPVILHLAGERPWYKGSTHPYKDEFYKLKELTPWKDEPLKSVSYGFSKDIRKRFRAFLTKMRILPSIVDPYNRDRRLSERQTTYQT